MTAVDTLTHEGSRSLRGDFGDASGAPVLTRVSFSFSPTGTTAACLAADEQGEWQIEAWSFSGPSPRRRALLLAGAVTPSDQLVPLDDGSVLLCRNRRDAHEIVVLEPHVSREGDRLPGGDPGGISGATRERMLAAVQSRGLRVLASPGVGLLGMAIATDERGCSTLWRISRHSPYMDRVAELPGFLLGGVWLDDTGTLLAVDRAEEGGPAKAVAIDLRDGSCTPMLDISEASNDRLLLCHPRSGLLLVSTDATGEERLGWGRLSGPEPVRFPDTLHRPSHTTYPLTFDPDGQRVLVHFDEGVRSRLAVYTPVIDDLAPVEIPMGRVRGAASWIDEVVRFPFSTPTQPTTVATLRIGEAGSWSIVGRGDIPERGKESTSGARWAQAHVEWLDCPAGPVEAVIYGGKDWRANRHLVLALHGGPLSAWRFEFQPFFQRLAGAGIAVVAPNQRGSIGYGTAHTLAIRGAWGGPDLDDVRGIARALVTERRAAGLGGLALFGVSYGAFLALLAASCETDLWSRCVVLAPFLSGPSLYHEASPRVRMLLEQLGGCQELHDDFGPRDVLRLCHGIRARLLVAHGDQDSVIPVAQSRGLRCRLLELGRREGMDFEYLEIPGGRHELLNNADGNVLHQQIVRFLLNEECDQELEPQRRNMERR